MATTAERAGPRSARGRGGAQGSDGGCPPDGAGPAVTAPRCQGSCWTSPPLPFLSPVSSHKIHPQGVSCCPPSCARGAPILSLPLSCFPAAAGSKQRDTVKRAGHSRQINLGTNRPPPAKGGRLCSSWSASAGMTRVSAWESPPLCSPCPQIPLHSVRIPPHPGKSGSKPRRSLGHA